MGLATDLKATYIKAAKALKGSERRMFMARIVKNLGYGGQSLAERELGWNRETIRKGITELEEGPIEDNFSARGRKKAEDKLPNLLSDIQVLVDGQSQTDPTFQSTRLYTRLSVAEIRRQLMSQKNYTGDELPGEEALRLRVNQLGYNLRSVQKSRPQKDS